MSSIERTFELALRLVSSELSSCQPCLECPTVSVLGALAHGFGRIWSRCILSHMCRSPSNIHLSPPEMSIAVRHCLFLQWNEAEIYVMLPVGDISCTNKQSRMQTHVAHHALKISQRISGLSNVCLVKQQIASILHLPRHTLL